MEGTDADLVNVLSEKMGFSWEAKYESSFLAFDKTGRISGGTYGAVANNRSDLGIGHLAPDNMPEGARAGLSKNYVYSFAYSIFEVLRL